MKVLIVSEPGVDGVFRYVESICHYLIGEGVSVHFAYSDKRSSDRLYKLIAFVRDNGGMTINMRTANQPAFSDIGAFAALLKIVRITKPDVIHSHSSKAGALARVLPFIGVSAVQLYHPHAYIGMRPKKGRLDFLYNYIESFLGRRAHTIVCSSGEKAFALENLKLPKERVHWIRHGVDNGLFSPISITEKKALRESLGLPVDIPLLGFLGRSSAQKDPVTLYTAFAQLAKERKNVALFHVGKGELDPELERVVAATGIGHMVFRRPYMTTPVHFYRSVDGFILTSKYEGFSLAALEALSCNLPMILSDAAGNADLLSQPLSHAWKAAPGDVDGFARCMKEWHTSALNQSPINHRDIALSYYGNEEQLQAILRLFRERSKALNSLSALSLEKGGG
ncbi:MAG TPA: glycosyltransferase family 4 protein [Opitutaceae bacterium]|nr:glycosyltransferase family 4 protein [Opitutaceae bacterium]